MDRGQAGFKKNKWRLREKTKALLRKTHPAYEQPHLLTLSDEIKNERKKKSCLHGRKANKTKGGAKIDPKLNNVYYLAFHIKETSL
jgi:hypothetical protein